MVTKIVKLEMKGFKSFAHKTDLLFGDKFNVILGPNGSGKSNVIDALCFVLGKSSAKGLRAEKSANLIYNGGKTAKPSKEGEVDIYFDNKDKDFPLDTAEVKITRIIKDSGQSVYKINGKTHTRSEVIDLLHFAKINPDGYNIILQGDIIRFVEMSGDERRKIIEQIADISTYEEKKQKALLELEKVDASLKEASIILTERKNYLKDLSGEKEQAIRYETVEKQSKQAKAALLQQSINQKASKVSEYEQKNATHSQEKEQIQHTINKLKDEIKTKRDEIEQINRQIETQGDAKQVELHKQIEVLKIAIATDAHKIHTCNEEIEKITTRKNQLLKTKQDILLKITDLDKQQLDLAKHKNAQLSLQTELKDRIQTFKSKNNMDGAQSIEKQIDDLDKQIEVKQKEVDQLREQQQDSLRNQDRLEMQIRNADEKIQKVVEVSKQHHKEIEILKQKKIEFKSVTVDLSKLLSSDSTLATQLGNAKSRMHFLQEELAKMNARRASIQETLGGSMAITKVIESKHKIGGVHGTISSLGTVEERYAKALEVAAGAKIKSIVVDDDAVAQKSIEFLKENKLGIASFMPLNKIKPREEELALQKFAKLDGVHGFALDLIKFDKKFSRAFSNVFGNTLVVENLSIARKIGIGNAKMVTLDGDVSETSGVMQGGFREKTSTGLSFSSKEVTEKTEKLQKELDDNALIVSKLEKEKLTREEDITRLRELKATLEGEIIKSEKSLHLDDSDLDISKKLKDEFSKELEIVKKTSIQLQMSVSTINRDLAQLKINKQQLRMQMTELRSPAKLAELNAFEEKLRHTSDELIKIDSEMRHMSAQKANILLPEQENIETVVKQQEKELLSFQQKIAELHAQTTTRKAELAVFEEQEKEFYQKFKKAFEQKNLLVASIEKLESQLINREEQIREFERKVNAVSIEVAKVAAELAVLREEFIQYTGIELSQELLAMQPDGLKRIIFTSEEELKQIGPVNLKAVAMYDRVNAEYEKLVHKREILVSEKENVLIMINEIEVRKKDIFLLVFDRLNKNFQKIFQTITTKGEAFLELENPEQPFEGGVNVKVKLSGNKFMDIRSLSGGEKTMTALSFIFAIQENDPSSFYIMDEVDAALDKKNAEKLAELIAQYCTHAQYVVISHNDGVISSANTLYGVSMEQQSGTSKVVSLRV